jgi:hypothetical protein
VLETILPNTYLNLFASTLEIILKSFASIAQVFFGIRETKVALRLFSNWHWLWNSAKMLRTYVRRRKRGQEAKEDLARVQGEDTSGGWVEKARNARKEIIP